MSILELLKDEDRQEAGQMEGVAIGIVTNNKDPEGLGRVKVRFPWRENKRESHWARVATPGAGKDRGLYWVPELDDEVLLVCDKKNIEHLFVIGSLWNGPDKAPAKNADGENNIRLIKTRSGHEIRMFDKAGQGKIVVKTDKGSTFTMDETTGAAKIEMKDSSGTNKFTIDATANKITIESGVSLKLKSQTIEIEAGASMKLKASGILEINGSLVKIN